MAAKNKKKKAGSSGIIAQNKRARHDYQIDEEIEAGIMLVGTEVKSLRIGTASINESYAGEKEGEIYLFNANIQEYNKAGNYFQHQPRRPRKLLFHKREVSKLLGAIQRKGMTLVPISMYFNKKGLVKVKIGIARGKKEYDKRETEKKRDWQRDKSRLLKEKG